MKAGLGGLAGLDQHRLGFHYHQPIKFFIQDFYLSPAGLPARGAHGRAGQAAHRCDARWARLV